MRFPCINPQNRLSLWKTFKRNTNVQIVLTNTLPHSLTKTSIVIWKARTRTVVMQLSELTHIGIEVLIITTASNPETEHLLQKGLSVRILPEVKLCTTIIDKDIVWYGAINALGYATEGDNVIKVVDNKLANELLEVLLTS